MRTSKLCHAAVVVWDVSATPSALQELCKKPRRVVVSDDAIRWRNPVIHCPKCDSSVDPAATECARCGVVFAKLEQRALIERPLPSSIEKPQTAPRDPAAEAISGLVRIGRIATLLGLSVWTWQFARRGIGGSDSVLHLPNLVFHEAGHVLFGLFGRFMTVLGGSLFQIVFPLVFAVAFLRQKNPFAASVCTWWAGQNFLDVAPYIADARALQLVLLGGRTGAEVEGHDWEYILTQLGWTHLDVKIGLGASRVGLMIMCASILWGAAVVAMGKPTPPAALDGE
jgi:hypothetical protein